MENEVFAGRSSFRNHVLSIFSSMLFGLMGLLLIFSPDASSSVVTMLTISAALLCYPFLMVYGSSYLVTSERVTARSGILSRSVSEVELADIRNVKVDQGILQRLLGIGDVGISTAGQSGMEITFRGVNNPAGVAELIRTQRKATTPE